MYIKIPLQCIPQVGGSPYIDRPDFVPNYPMSLPVLNISVGTCALHPFKVRMNKKIKRRNNNLRGKRKKKRHDN